MTPAEYVRAGWALVPIPAGLKGPEGAAAVGWNKLENCVTAESGVSRITANVGLAHAYSGTCAVDLDDLAAALAWFSARGVDLHQYLADPAAVCIDSGRPNKAKLLFRLETPLQTVQRKDADCEMVFELRSASKEGKTVQDVLPPSIHRDTGQPYRWKLGPLADWKNPPPLPDALRAIWLAEIENDGKAGAPSRAEIRELAGLRDPVANLLRVRGMIRSTRKDGGLNVECPNAREHTTHSGDTETVYYPAHTGGYERGNFQCMHAHCAKLARTDYLRLLGFQEPDVLGLIAAPKFNSASAAVGAETFRKLPPAPEFIVPGLLPVDIGSMYGEGGIAKTTLYLYMAAHIITGRQLFGHPIGRPGKVLLVSAEDDIKRIRHRLFAIGRGLELTDAEIELLGTNLLVQDVTGTNARLVESDERGNLTQSAAVGELIEAYRGAGIVLMLIDPAVQFGPGERFVNDGEQALVGVAARIKRELGCAVGFAHHTGKANARAGVTDQYAGRGGSALSDGMRWVWVLTTHRRDDSDHKAPTSVPPAAMAEGRLLRLHIAKLTDAPRPRDPIWILRNGFTFERVMPQVRTDGEKRRVDLERLLGFMRGELEQGIRHTKNSLEAEAARIGVGRNVIRSLVHAGLELGKIVERDLPESEKRGRKQQFLDPGSDPELHVGGEA